MKIDEHLTEDQRPAQWLSGLGEQSTRQAQNILAILGTSRSDGNTAKLVNGVISHLNNASLVDLQHFTIAPYNYDNLYHDDDDFLSLAYAMTKAQAIIFASPVYWYSMSAPMKTLFDRLTDLTRIHKNMGKALSGKSMFVIATGGSPQAPTSFAAPFAQTASYFNMHWGCLLYTSPSPRDS